MTETEQVVDAGEEANTSSGEIAVGIFTLPFVNDNASGWGPNNLPEKYKDLPYQKFSKSDRIGKVRKGFACNALYQIFFNTV